MRSLLALPLLCLIVTLIVFQRSAYAQSANVLYGSSTGLPADATIKQVTFSRSGDDLETAFQVVGQISQIYQYAIGIEFYPAYDGYYTYQVYNWEAGASYVAYYLGNRTGTRIQGTVRGDTWTAYTPLSMIGNRTHFWVWMVTLNPSTEQLVDCYPTSADISAGTAVNFEVELPAQVAFKIEPNSLASNVTLTVDGTQYSFNATGNLPITIVSGINHTAIISSPIQSSNSVRYVVGSWSDGPSTNSRTLEVDQDSTITVTYKTQFLLSVNSSYGTTRGAGWYDNASTATISVSPTRQEYDGFLGTLGLQVQFNGWIDDVASTSTPFSFVMDSPKTVTANWSTVYSVQFLVFLCLVIGVPIVGVLLFYQRRIVARPRKGTRRRRQSVRERRGSKSRG